MAEIMTAKESAKNRIRRILIDSLELDLKEDEIESGVNFDELFGLDSIAVIEFLIALEKEFSITIESERLTSRSLRNLDGLAAYIEKLTGGRKPA
jgi:acyl carrier protein